MYGEFDLFIKMLNFSDHPEIGRYHQKSHVTLVTILVFFDRYYVVPHSFSFDLGFFHKHL